MDGAAQQGVQQAAVQGIQVVEQLQREKAMKLFEEQEQRQTCHLHDFKY